MLVIVALARIFGAASPWNPFAQETENDLLLYLQHHQDQGQKSAIFRVKEVIERRKSPLKVKVRCHSKLSKFIHDKNHEYAPRTQRSYTV